MTKPRLVLPGLSDDAREGPTSRCACGHDGCGDRRAVSSAGAWSSILPLVACAFCPVCLSTYAKLGSALGAGAALGEGVHTALLGFALALSLGVSAWRWWVTRRTGPLVLTLFGVSVLGAGHVAETVVLEWTGIAAMIASGLWERMQRDQPLMASGGR